MDRAVGAGRYGMTMRRLASGAPVRDIMAMVRVA
jgi:hypothetical protein